jgi:hypothetical protein
MSGAEPAFIDKPFFTLEYENGVFVRKIPPGAEDLGNGLFREGERLLRLPGSGAEWEALRGKIIRGRALLALLSRGNPLIKAGPRLAGGDERLMELAWLPGESDPEAAKGRPFISIEIRRELIAASSWLPLDGLPRHRLCRNVIYEIIDEETLSELAARYGGPGRIVLKGEDIPRFADTRPRLIFRFGGESLRRLLAEEELFLSPERGLSLILSAERGAGRPSSASLALRAGKRRYDCRELSGLLEREYLLLEDKWVRRAELVRMGLLPLGCWAGGRVIEKLRPGGAELFSRRMKAAGELSLPVEWERERWIAEGAPETIFSAHLEFLMDYGLSGGVVVKPHSDQAAYLARWLKPLSLRLKGGSALILMEKSYYELYLTKLLPLLRTIPVSLPGEKFPGHGISLRFWGDPAEGTWDLLVLVEPEELVRNRDAAGSLPAAGGGTSAPPRLGIFSGRGELSGGGAEGRDLERLFGTGAAERDYGAYLVRNVNAALPLPEGSAAPGDPVARPETGGKELISFRDPVKFRKLPAADLLDEMALFHEGGKKAPFVLMGTEKPVPYFNLLSRDERDYFLYWRGRFREDEILRAEQSLILLYARELVLCMGGDSKKDFDELFRLWRAYRGEHPGLDALLPQWLLDFAAVYGIAGAVLPRLLPRAGEADSAMLLDLHIRSRFIGENNGIAFQDLRRLLPEHPGLPQKEFTAAINGIDRYLREHYRIRFFEFFYPPLVHEEERKAFPGLPGAGESCYTASWIRFSGHRPLLEFLEALALHVEFRRKLRPLSRRPLDEPWKSIADSAMGLGEGPPPSRQTRPEKGSLEKLREESARVRELLLITGGGEAGREGPPIAAPETGKRAAPPSIEAFLSSLDEGRAGVLALIAAGAPLRDLEALARKNMSMPELIIDDINAGFQELFQDLLIETAGTGCRIQAEYEAAVKEFYAGEGC